MHRINVVEAGRDFSNLVERVHSEGIRVELERGNLVIACISPVRQPASLTVQQLNAFLSTLPKLADDAEAFSNDVRAIRRDLPAEANPWD